MHLNQSPLKLPFSSKCDPITTGSPGEQKKAKETTDVSQNVQLQLINNTHYWTCIDVV